VIGVSKAYITRVGSGPFPTEIEGAAGESLRKEGNEFGAVTGRPRRCGWFDVPLLKYTAMVNGLDTLLITKLDVLDHLDEIPVCTGYKLNGKTIAEMPATYRAMEAIEPVYETHPGWKTSTRGITQFEDLPQPARTYLNHLEKLTGVEIGGVSTGPERNETIIRPGSKLEKLIG
jgi:adenylosuccinate synthase